MSPLIPLQAIIQTFTDRGLRHPPVPVNNTKFTDRGLRHPLIPLQAIIQTFTDRGLCHPLVPLQAIIQSLQIEGYCKQKEYIATQGPRQKTIPCFWHMVWQENVHCIVMATGLFENANQQCDKYWGDVFSAQRYVRHGDIHIWLDATMEMAQLTVRSFRIQHEGSSIERKVKHFEMVGFNDEATDPGFILDVCRRVNNHVKATAGPILVHCRDIKSTLPTNTSMYPLDMIGKEIYAHCPCYI
ncbi:LAR [Mytilus edulis]|uniref:PTPRF n=1 Tax=Mytilus edulis TaxID=6550 RepID=A0A8S3RNB1_MYTED|nr:LAR [Mytilus edulis]